MGGDLPTGFKMEIIWRKPIRFITLGHTQQSKTKAVNGNASSNKHTTTNIIKKKNKRQQNNNHNANKNNKKYGRTNYATKNNKGKRP